jgi:hypothetical protein
LLNYKARLLRNRCQTADLVVRPGPKVSIIKQRFYAFSLQEHFMVGLLYLTVKICDWYVNPLPVGAMAILIKFLHSSFGRAERAAER